MRSPYLGTFINYGDPHADLGTAFTVRYEENNIRDIQALIIGLQAPHTNWDFTRYDLLIQGLAGARLWKYRGMANQL